MGTGRRTGHGEAAVAANWQGSADSLYFSSVTALSIGYGDVTPVGAVRALAILDSTTGLVLFGWTAFRRWLQHWTE